MVNRFNKLRWVGSGWCRRGKWGATPYDILAYLNSRNIKWSFVDIASIDNRHDSPGIYILSYWNTPFTRGYHTVAIAFDGNEYIAYNYYSNSSECSEPRVSLSSFMNNRSDFIECFYISYEKNR